MVTDENAAPNDMSVAARCKSQQLAGSCRGASRGCSSGLGDTKKRGCDENAAPKTGIVANHPKPRPLATSNQGTETQKKIGVRSCNSSSRAFRDLTNTNAGCLTSVDTAKDRRPQPQATSNRGTETHKKFEVRSRNSSSRAMRDLTNTNTECSTSADTAKIRRLANSEFNNGENQCQLSVPVSHPVKRQRLPSAVMATILEMAGFKFDRTECAYIDTIIKNDWQKEAQNMPHRGFILEQRSLNGRMRAILVDWIAQVLDMNKFSRRTLFLTVSLIDRCFCCMPIDKSNLQLLGTAAFLIAAKVEEIHPPELTDLIYICDGAYTMEQLLSMECAILINLDFRTDGPTVEHFLPHLIAASQSRDNLGPDPILATGLASLWEFSAACDRDESRNDIAWFLAELALLDVRMSHYPPSQVSASALYLASILVNHVKPRDIHMEFPKLWDDALVQISGYTESMLLECVDDLNRLRTAALSDTLQQINKRHVEAVDVIRHVTFQPGTRCCSGSSPYAVVAPVVPYPC